MQKELTLSSDSSDTGSRKCKQGSAGTCGEILWHPHLAGLWQSVLYSCIWQEADFSQHDDVFTFNLHYKEIL
jgi:hypothetical protein